MKWGYSICLHIWTQKGITMHIPCTMPLSQIGWELNKAEVLKSPFCAIALTEIH